MFKGLLAFLFALMVSFPSVGNAAETSKFPDVSNFREEILYLNAAGIIKGYDNGNFGPKDPIKRVQAVVMIMRELGINVNNPVDPGFSDMKPGANGYNEVAKAVQLGIISGGTDKFNPNGQLTRAQMAKILTKAYDLKGNSTSQFKDVKMDSWVYPFVHALAAHQITTGYADGTFKPNETMTRMHFAGFMARYLNDEFKPVPTSTREFSVEELALNEQSVLVIEVYDEKNNLISQGSGFVVSNQLIATNFHVISGGVKAKAISAAGERFDLSGVVAYDDRLDVALLKPSKRTGLPPLTLTGYDQVRKGQKVVAIGSPLGFQNTISEGIVSGKQVFEDEVGPVNVIQSTAHITFGSSGGPLFNMNGKVIGINTFGIETMNFALATDYVTNLLKPLKGKSFQEIGVKSFASMPVIEIPEDTEWDEEVIGGGKEPVTPTLPPAENAGMLMGTKQTLNDILIDAVHDPELSVVYGINENGELISVNYETKKIMRLPFSFPAESIYYANGEIYVTLLKGEHSSYWWHETQKGGVAIVDPASLTVKKMFNLALDPYDIVADDNHFYVSSGSGQWTYLKSYNRETGVEVSSAGIRQQSQIELHPSKNRIYAVNSDSSPRDMEVFFIDNGVITKGYDSPYHGEHRMQEWMTVSPDGKYVFNGSGAIFRATMLKETNMQYVTSLKTPFYSVSFSEDKFYISIGKEIVSYDYETFLPVKSWTLSGDGYFHFYHKGHLIIVGEEVPNNSNLLKTYILKAKME